MEFEWDPAKAAANLRKHGVSFEEGSTVFGDPFAGTGADPEHSIGEERWLVFGFSEKGRLLVVSYLEHNERIRIVSAREATKREHEIYEKG